MYLLLLFSILAFPQPALSAVSVPPTVVIKLPYENALLPCNYTPPSHHPPNQSIVIHWERQGVDDLIVEKNSVGKVTESDGFHLSGACSLVLKSPINQSGIYTVTLHYAGLKYDSSDVQVHVFNETTILYSNDDDSEKTGCAGWIAGTGFSIVLVILIVGLVLYIRRQKPPTRVPENTNLMGSRQENTSPDEPSAG